MSSFEMDITEIQKGVKLIEAKADQEAKSAATKELKSILYKITHATTEDQIDSALDKLAKGAINHDFSADKVALLQKEVDRKLAKLKAGNKEETEPTAEVEAELEEVKDKDTEKKTEEPVKEEKTVYYENLGEVNDYLTKKYGKTFDLPAVDYEKSATVKQNDAHVQIYRMPSGKYEVVDYKSKTE